MSAATKARTAAGVVADIEARQARHAALTDELGSVRASLASLRTDRARAVADGKRGPSPAEVGALAEEESGLVAALELLASDLERLEAERAVVALTEAEGAERAAIAHARSALDALDENVRALGQGEILPLADALLDALREAHDAENETNRLRRLHDPSGPSVVGSRTERAVMHRRGELLAAIDAVRRFVAPSRTVVSVKPSVVKEPEEVPVHVSVAS